MPQGTSLWKKGGKIIKFELYKIYNFLLTYYQTIRIRSSLSVDIYISILFSDIIGPIETFVGMFIGWSPTNKQSFMFFVDQDWVAQNTG